MKPRSVLFLTGALGAMIFLASLGESRSRQSSDWRAARAGATGVLPASGSGIRNTLDEAYDEGGVGAGRTIVADAGAVSIAGPDGLFIAGDLVMGQYPDYSTLIVDGQGSIWRYAGAHAAPALRITQHSNHANPDQTAFEVVGGVTDESPRSFRLFTDSGDPYSLKAHLDGRMVIGDYPDYGSFHLEGKASILCYSSGGPDPALRITQHSDYANGAQMALDVVGGVTDESPRSFRICTYQGDPYNLRMQMQGTIEVRDQAGETTIRLDPETGTTRTKVLEITGADLVEGFESDPESSSPGTVMSIDPDRPGRLVPSSTAYDRKVAGVVSGANGVDHGIHLGQDSQLDGDTLIAMTGRVYVRCTTENGSIVPGDLLTTSSLEGRAMKATDSLRAFGAVIGKAMSRLDSGEGLVLVLVDKQ